MTDHAEEIDVKGIDKAVRKVFKKLFSKSGAVIDEVCIKGYYDYDHDGDPLLRILIVFESKDDKLDLGGMVGFRRYLSAPLENLGEEAFPVIRFATRAEKKERDARIETEAKQAVHKIFGYAFPKKEATLVNVSLRDEPNSDGIQRLRVEISFEAEGGKLDPSGIREFEDDFEYFMETTGDYRLPLVKFTPNAKGKRRQKETRHEAA